MSATTRDALTDAIRAVRADGQGLLRLWFISPADGLDLALASLCGDSFATGLLGAAASCAKQVMQAPRRKPTLCLCCPRPVRALEGVTFCIATPEAENPGRALGTVVCTKCAVAPDLERRAMRGFRRIWPDIREIQMMPGSGAVN